MARNGAYVSRQQINGLLRRIDRTSRRIDRQSESLMDRIESKIISVAKRQINSIHNRDVYEPSTIMKGVTEHFNNLAKGHVEWTGYQVTFIEFGTGIHFNGNVGSSPHPNGSKLGMTIGSYGHHLGRFKHWYYDNPIYGEIRTQGIKARMPLYKGINEARASILEIAARTIKF